MFVADLDPRFAKIPGKADQIDPARRSMDSGLPLYDAAPSKLVNLDGELRYVMTIGVATIMNVQGHTDTIKNTKLDAAYRLDQAKMAETQFTYLQTTSLVDRRHPRRIKLADVDIQTTEEMKGQHFEAKTNCSELEAQYQGLPEMGNIDSKTDLQEYTIKALAELNYIGKSYHNNKRSAIQQAGWYQFENKKLYDTNGRLVRTKDEAKAVIQARQFMALLPKLALTMVKTHAVFARAGIQVNWFLPGTNNLTRLLKNVLAFNSKISKVNE